MFLYNLIAYYFPPLDLLSDIGDNAVSATQRGCLSPNLADAKTKDLMAREDNEVAETFGLQTIELTSQFHYSLKQLVCGPERFSPNCIFESVKRYQSIVDNQLGVFQELTKAFCPLHDISVDEFFTMIERLTQEFYTWKLVLFLHSELFQNCRSPRKMEIDEITVYHFVSEKKVIDYLLANDHNVRKYNAVILWLEEIASCRFDNNPLQTKCLSRNICFENTLIELKDSRRKPVNPNLVSEIDPDSSLRQNKKISELDQKDELMLSQCVWHHIRAGRIQEAQDLLQKVGQPMKASIFEGGKYYHDPNLENEPKDLGIPEIIEGNIQRDIWKFIVWKMSEDTRFNVYERAIFGVLAGNLQRILPVCKNWSDWLWANYKVMLDVYYESEIRNTSYYRKRNNPRDLPSNYWQQNLEPEIIFSELQGIRNEEIHRYSNSQFGVIQFYLITNQLDILIDTIYNWITTSREPGTCLGTHFLRFVAHLVIYFRQIELSVSNVKCDIIIEKYITELIILQQYEMVCTYTACLVSTFRQVTCYSNLLKIIPKGDCQKTCLNLARDSGLNISLIIQQIIESVNSEESLCEYQSDIEDSISLSVSDSKKIQILDWLLYDENHLQEALTQGLALIRLFLCMSKHIAASQTFKKLPRNILVSLLDRWKRSKGNAVTPNELDNHIKEFLCYDAYFAAREAFEEWFTSFYRRRSHSPDFIFSEVIPAGRSQDFNIDLSTWQESLAALQSTAENKIEKVLLFEGGWMVDRIPLIEEINSERRTQQEILRTMYIPIMCFLLYSLLKDSGYYQSCLRISNIVASEDYKLYQLFNTQDFKRFLSLMKEASILLSERKEIDYLGYPI